MKAHTAPWECTYAKEDSSICRPGKRPSSDNEYFEILCLIVFQSGLNWNSVRKKWSRIKETFCDFSIDRIAKLRPKDITMLLGNQNMIRNEKKIKAIINNAKQFKRIIRKYGSFKMFLEKIKNESPEEKIKELIEKFEYVGKYSAEYFLHSVGET